MQGDGPIDLESMRRIARAAGFTWSDAELEAIKPAADALLALLARLDAADLGDAEPAAQYRVL
jgi:Asp-tRNA(Asn)/Glu-tRNA(Gln) amidotransferase C subunit